MPEAAHLLDDVELSGAPPASPVSRFMWAAPIMCSGRERRHRESLVEPSSGHPGDHAE